jgi:hypothetical protein
MDVIRLAAGERAPDVSDSISILLHRDGRAWLKGVLLARHPSVALIYAGPFASRRLAEAGGAIWADENGVARLYVVVSTKRSS